MEDGHTALTRVRMQGVLLLVLAVIAVACVGGGCGGGGGASERESEREREREKGGAERRHQVAENDTHLRARADANSAAGQTSRRHTRTLP